MSMLSFSDENIHPFKYLRIHRDPNGSTVVLWQHSVVDSLKYYSLHFRPVRPTQNDLAQKWRPLVNIIPEYSSSTKNMTSSFIVQDFLNSTTYEINIAIVGRTDEVLVSVSVFADPFSSPNLKGLIIEFYLFLLCSPLYLFLNLFLN